jgi:hypothetical protein
MNGFRNFTKLYNRALPIASSTKSLRQGKEYSGEVIQAAIPVGCNHRRDARIIIRESETAKTTGMPETLPRIPPSEAGWEQRPDSKAAPHG